MEEDHLKVILEDVDSKFKLVLDAYALLNAKMDRNQEETNQKFGEIKDDIKVLSKSLNQKIDTVEAHLSARIDAVAEDLKAHRADTEIHHTPYRVNEPT